MDRSGDVTGDRSLLLGSATMDPHERATSVWYRVAGLLRKKEIAIDVTRSSSEEGSAGQANKET